MKPYIFALAVYFAYTSSEAKAQNDVVFNSQTPGTITKSSKKYAKAKRIKVLGTVGEEDIKFLSKKVRNHHSIEIVDLRNCNGVDSIPDSLFYNCQFLREIKLPKKTKAIGSSAFMMCTSLKSINLGDSVVFLGANALNGCKSLYSVTLPKRLEHIGNGAFSNCKNLLSIALPFSIKYVGDEAFNGCETLHSVYSYAATPPKSEPNSFTGSAADCILYTNPLSIEQYKEDFNWKRFDRIYPISESADKSLIRHRTTTDGTLVINTKKAGTLSQQLTIEWISAKSLCIRGPLNTYDLYFLKDIAKQNKVQVIDLFGSTGLSILPDSLFQENNSIQKIVLPNTIESIGNYTFKECVNLQTIRLPQNLKRIGKKAFANCTSIQSIHIPSKVDYIGSHAFRNCSMLVDVVLPDFLHEIKSGTFQGCKNLKSITLPEHLHIIGGSVFSECRNLREITMAESIDTIGSSAFESCTSLKTIQLPQQLKSIKKKAFWNCTNLHQVSFPNKLETIEDWAFKDCVNLDSIQLGEHITTIGDLAFSNCTKLNYVSVKAITPPLNTNAFDKETRETVIIEVPEKAIGNYILNNGWWNFPNIKATK